MIETKNLYHIEECACPVCGENAEFLVENTWGGIFEALDLGLIDQEEIDNLGDQYGCLDCKR